MVACPRVAANKLPTVFLHESKLQFFIQERMHEALWRVPISGIGCCHQGTSSQHCMSSQNSLLSLKPVVLCAGYWYQSNCYQSNVTHESPCLVSNYQPFIRDLKHALPFPFLFPFPNDICRYFISFILVHVQPIGNQPAANQPISSQPAANHPISSQSATKATFPLEKQDEINSTSSKRKMPSQEDSKLPCHAIPCHALAGSTRHSEGFLTSSHLISSHLYATS
mmetsp:Transcript_11183/g.13225  ORF Transcript_11183/g.13225 Transcript_11183/m.13225 type:complete len:224 (-) Transcript_11183:62-733(-)